jgi:hypothetical protein
LRTPDPSAFITDTRKAESDVVTDRNRPSGDHRGTAFRPVVTAFRSVPSGFIVKIPNRWPDPTNSVNTILPGPANTDGAVEGGTSVGGTGVLVAAGLGDGAVVAAGEATGVQAARIAASARMVRPVRQPSASGPMRRRGEIIIAGEGYPAGS